MRQPLRWSLVASVLVAFLPLTVATASSSAASSSRSSCHAPRMIGLTVTAARSEAKKSGCRLRLIGASARMPRIQTIRRQSARPGQVTKLLTLTVNPLCPGTAAQGPPPGEPLLTPGPTELDTGLFIEGGALIYRSAPVCKALIGRSSAGTITVTNFAGTPIANMALTAGQLLKVTLSAGQYTITGAVSYTHLTATLARSDNIRTAGTN